MAILSRKPVEARRLGPTLIATFNRSNPPLIWRFDLERNHSFTLALQGEDGEWELGLTSPKGEFYPVARFALREDAEDSFALIGDIMSREPRPWWGFFMRGIGVAFLVLLIVALGFAALVGWNVHKADVASRIEMQAASPVTAAPQAPALRSGVPQSADDVLKPPQ